MVLRLLAGGSGGGGGGPVEAGVFRVSVSNNEANGFSLSETVPLLKTKNDGGGASPSPTTILTGGPYARGAGDTVCSVQIESTLDTEVGDIEIRVSNADATEVFYTYFPDSVELAAGVFRSLHASDFAEPSGVGSDLTMTSGGAVKTTAGGVFFVEVLAQVTAPTG